MLSSLEMVSEPSGKTKTLIDLIKEGSIITPDTPVYTSDDSVTLKEFIESMIPAPKSKAWIKYGGDSAITWNTSILLPEEIRAEMIKDVPAFTDIIVVIHETYAQSVVTMADTFENFKKWFTDNTANKYYYQFIGYHNAVAVVWMANTGKTTADEDSFGYKMTSSNSTIQNHDTYVSFMVR